MNPFFLLTLNFYRPLDLGASRFAKERRARRLLLLLAGIVTTGLVLSLVGIKDRAVYQLSHPFARVGRTLILSHRPTIRPPDAGKTDLLRENALAD
jgi:hypothetical protein